MTARARSRIDARFAALKAAGRTALMPFITAGDPLPEALPELLHALVAGGADMIELGMPFSDPMADGPVIQHADERALARGVTVAGVLAAVRAFRARDRETPIVFMGYLNPIQAFGWERFAAAATEAGVDGVLLVDCPVEEMAISAPLRAAGLQQILLVAPTTAPERLTAIRAAASGFLYYVAYAGVTGAASLAPDAIADAVRALRAAGPVPVAVGFGVRDAASALAIADFADGVVIGSALVERLAGASDAADLAERAQAFLAPIRAALDASAAGQTGEIET